MAKRVKSIGERRKERRAKRDEEVKEIQALRNAVANCSETSSFKDLPISGRTKQGLELNHFVELTPVQRACIPAALGGSDIVAVAKTGSGKTLAFCIPLVERLYREGWGQEDGLGGLIISPTRELALQIFEVLRRVASKHGFSAGLLIGGKGLAEEREAVGRMNILVATPGRLLHHMDQAAGFEWSNLQVLVLDEADRILDLGFAKTMDAILAELPREGRQTMLFSATQSDASLQALIRVSLRPHDTLHVNVDGEAEVRTPAQLEQSFLVCPLAEKLDRLWSFIKSHLSCKSIIFLSSCKQVRFVYEAFCKLQPGVPLACLHGRQKQPKRLAIFQDFCKRRSAVLFATDLAARGLDFPAVDWVVQVDCPEDVDTYIHRVGRTARYQAAGKALLFLLPSEIALIEQLVAKRIPVAPMHPANKPPPPIKHTVNSKLQALCAQDQAIKYLAQTAFKCYCRSVYLAHDKTIFKFDQLPLAEYAMAMGLPGQPRLRFAPRSAAKNASRTLPSSDSEEEEEERERPRQVVKKTVERMFGRKNQDVLSEHYSKLRASSDDEESEDEGLLQVKRKDHEIDEESIPVPKAAKLSRRDALKTKKRYLLKSSERSTRLVFDDQGEAKPALPYLTEHEVSLARDQHLAEQRRLMREVDAEDAEREKQLRREKRRLQKEKQRAIIE